jgi:hypothetical protein
MMIKHLFSLISKQKPAFKQVDTYDVESRELGECRGNAVAVIGFLKAAIKR